VRIGWLGDYGGHLALEPGVLEMCERALKDLAGIGCAVEPTPLGFDPERVWQTFRVLRHMMIGGKLKALWDDPAKRALIKPEAQWEVEQALALDAIDVYEASASRTAWYQHVLTLFERFDFLGLPTAQFFPFAAEMAWPSELAGRKMDSYHRWMEVVVGVTLAGVPAISVPAGFDTRGLPMGIQLVGPPRGELAVLQLAHAYDAATQWVRRRQPAALSQR